MLLPCVLARQASLLWVTQPVHRLHMQQSWWCDLHVGCYGGIHICSLFLQIAAISAMVL